MTSAFLEFPSSGVTGDIRGSMFSLENTSWLDLSTACVPFRRRDKLLFVLAMILGSAGKASIKSPNNRKLTEQYIPTTGTASSILRDSANSGFILTHSSNHIMGKNMVGTSWNSAIPLLGCNSKFIWNLAATSRGIPVVGSKVR